MACHGCDLLHRVPALPEKSRARCSRCGAVLVAHRPNSIDRSLAFSIAGIILLFLANLYPFLSLESQGVVLNTTLITGVIMLVKQSMMGLAALVLLTGILVPFVLLCALVYVLLSLKRGYHLPARRRMFRLALILRPWSMTEVFLLGILVSVVKLAKMATIIPGTALFSFLALVCALAAVNVSLDPGLVWKKMDQ